MLLNVVPLLASTAFLGLMAAELESSYERYFQQAGAPKLAKPYHTDFRTFHEKNLTSLWSFFKFPPTNEEITAVDSIQQISCRGDGILGSNTLLDHALESVFEELPRDTQDRSRLGFFKMFPGRISSRPLDAYLHHLLGGWKFTLVVSGQMTETSFKSLIRGLSLFITGDETCSPLFSGLVGSVESQSIKLEIFSPIFTPMSSLGQLKEALINLAVWNQLGFTVTVSDPETVDEKEEQALEVAKLFLAECPKNDMPPAEPSIPLTADWTLLSARYPLDDKTTSYDKISSFEWARSFAAPTLVNSLSGLRTAFSVHAGQFPGVLSQKSSLAIVKKSYLLDEAVADFKEGKIGTIFYKSSALGRITIPFSGLPTYRDYAAAMRLIAEYFTTNQIVGDNVEAVFLHFVGAKTPAGSRIEILMWHKNSMSKANKTALRAGLHDYLLEHQSEMQ